MEIGRKIIGGFGDPRSGDEPQPGFIKLAQIRAREHASISDDSHLGDPVALLERFDDRSRVGGRGYGAPLAAHDPEIPQIRINRAT